VPISPDLCRRGLHARLGAALLLALHVAAPALAAGAAPGTGGGVVHLRDEPVLSLRIGRAGESAEERARSASSALARAVAESPDAVARVEVQGETAAVRVGRVTVLELGPADVAAEGAVGLEALAQTQASQLDRALTAERRRSRISEWVFDLSLLVFSGLLVFLLLGKLGELDRRASAWLRERPGRIPSMRVHGVELVSGDALAGAASVILRLGRYILQLTIAYAWIVFGLSLFPPTRGAGLQLGGVVLAPAAALLSRVGGALPALLGAFVAGVVLWVLVRALRLFFQSVADGETHVGWIPADLAVPVGELLRLAVVLLAAVFAAPVLTGSDQGVLAHVGTAALLAASLGAAPALANVAVGLPRLLRRTYRPGHVAEVGRAVGVVRAVDLLHVELEDATGARILVPHLAALVAPTRFPSAAAPFRFALAVDPSEDQARVRELVLRAGGPGTTADLLRLDAGAALYRVAGPDASLPVRVADALRSQGIRLARRGGASDPGPP